MPSRELERLEARRLLATTIHVTQIADANAFNPATSASTTANPAGPVSLRSAIDFVDNQTAAQILANGPYTIVFDLNGTFTNTLPFNGNQDNTGGALSIFNPNGGFDLTIQGNGAANTIIDGNNIDSVVLISPSGAAGNATFTNVTFSGVTIQHGLSQEDNGGGINFEATTAIPDPGPATGSGSLTINNSVITANHAATVAAGFGGNGGGIFVGTGALQPSPVALIVNGSSITGNTADRGGGGIAAVNAGVFLDKSTISGNHAKLFDTTGLGGGGVALNGGTKLLMSATNTTIAGNDTVGDGGGIEVSGLAGSQAVSLNNVTIADNRANTGNGAHQGGGINVAAGTATLKNTIVARNFTGSAGSTADDVKGTLAAASSFNLFGTGGSGGLAAVNGNQINVASPGLGTLSNNGGPTQTIALLAGSPALDAGINNVEFSAFDQRNSINFPRVADGPDADLVQTTDIGAFEADPSIQVIPDQSVVHDHSGSVTFNIGDSVFLAPNPVITTVTATSDNLTLQPNAGLVISGSGGTRSLSFTPAASMIGTAHITVTVSASNGQSMSTTFLLTVTDQAPTVSNFSKSGSVGTDVTFTAADFTSHFADADAGDSLQSVRIDTLPAVASGTLKLGINNVSTGQIIPLAQLGNLVFTPAQTGSPTFTWSASDGILFAAADATVTLNITGQPDLVVTKSGPASALAGNAITYTVTVTNSGNAPALSVSLGDTLPTGTTFVSQAQSNGPVFILGHTGNTITDTIASLASGDSATFTFVAQVGAGVANNTVLSNTATVASTPSDSNSANNSSTATTTITTQADLSIVKTGPATVVAGTNITYTVTITNNGPSDAQSVSITDTLPAGTAFVSQAQGSGPAFTLSNNGNAISDTIATLAAGASASFTIVASVNANIASGASLSNTATAGSTTSDIIPGNNSSTATTGVTTVADLAVIKTAPATGIAGTNITYTVTVSNGGPSDAQTVALTDTLPTGTSFVSQSQGSGPAFTLSNNGNAISDTIATLAAGASASFTIVALVSPSVPGGTVLSNTAAIGSATPDGGRLPNTSTATTTINAQADLAVTKTAPATAVVGTNFTYTVTVTNNGPSDAQAVALADTLPAGTTFISQAVSSGASFTLTNNGNAVSDTIATLAAGASSTISIVARVNPNVADATLLSNTATASTATTDPTSGNNSATATTTALARADVAVTKTAPANAVAGANVTYSVTVTNNGPSDAQAVVLADTLPAGTTFVTQTQGTGPAFTLSHNGNAISDTIATLAAGASATFTFVALLNPSLASGSSLSNTASVTTTTIDNIPGNNSSTVTTPVVTRADIAVAKTGPATAIAGTDFTYTVTLANNGPSDAQSVVLTDSLPTGTTLVSQTQTSGPAFTLGGGMAFIGDTIATLPAGSSASFTIVAHLNANVASGATLSNTANGSSTTTDLISANNSSTATTTVLTRADLAVTKTGPATAIAGTDFTYTVTLTNNGPSDAQSVVLTDSLPPGATVVSQTQTSGPAFTLSSGVAFIGDTIATLPAGSSASFTIVAHLNANVASGTTLSNTASGSSGTTDLISTNNNATATTTVVTQADLAVTKIGPATGIAGTNITYTISVANNGPSDAQTVALADTLPSGTTLVSQGQISGPPFNLTQAANTISDTIPTLAAGSSASFRIVALVGAGVADGTILNNTASASSGTTDLIAGNNAATAATTVRTQADVAVTKTGPATVIAGTNITYTVTVTNNGPSDAQNVALADSLPIGTTFVSQTQGAGPAFTLAHNGNAINDTIATLAAGASASFTFVALVSPSAPNGSTLSNTATGTSTTTETSPGNNSATANTAVNTLADLVVDKTAPATAIAGTNITYTVTLTNNGPSDAQAVTMADTLPAGTTFVSQSQSSGPLFTLTNNGPAISDTIATLAAGATARFTIVALVSPSVANGALVSNTAVGTSITTEASIQTNSDTATTTVMTRADLAVAKTGPAIGIAGKTITYTLTIANTGPSDAQGVALTDTLPAGTTLVSQMQASGPAFALGSVGNTISDTIATLPAGASASFAVVASIATSVPNNSTLSNTARGSTTTVDPNPANDASTFTTLVINQADVLVVKSGPANATALGLLTYTLTVRNNGPSDAQNVVLTDALPAGETFVSQMQTSGPAFLLARVGNTITDTVGSLPSGATATISLVAKLSGGLANRSTLRNTATVTTTTIDPVLANNTSTVTTTVSNAAVLLLDPSGRNALSLTQVSLVAATDPGAVVVNSTSPSAAVVAGVSTVLANETDVTGGAQRIEHGKYFVPVQHPAPTPDPLAGLPAPAMPATMRPAVNAMGLQTLQLMPGTYIGGIKVRDFATVTLAPGVYFLKGGGLSVSGHGALIGNNVLIVNMPSLATDTIRFSDQARVKLTPYSPTSPMDPYAAYRGVALMQPAPFMAPISITGTAVVSMTGRLYAPAARLNLDSAAVWTIKGDAVNAFPGQAILGDLTGAGAGGLYVDVNPSSNASFDPRTGAIGQTPLSHAVALALDALVNEGISAAILLQTDPTILNDLSTSFIKKKN